MKDPVDNTKTTKGTQRFAVDNEVCSDGHREDNEPGYGESSGRSFFDPRTGDTSTSYIYHPLTREAKPIRLPEEAIKEADANRRAGDTHYAFPYDRSAAKTSEGTVESAENASEAGVVMHNGISDPGGQTRRTQEENEDGKEGEINQNDESVHGPENDKDLKKILLCVVIALVIALAGLLGFLFREQIGSLFDPETTTEEITGTTSITPPEDSTTVPHDKGELSETTTADPSKKENTSTTTEQPTTTKPAGPIQLNWSDWSDSLPSFVTDSAYRIEERTLYQSRELETTSSSNSSMIGWECYDTVSGKGDYGPWSDWSQREVAKSDTRDVETQTRYRYSDKETKTSTSSSMSGWTLEDTSTSWGDYGSWSDWSTSAVSGSDSRKVETKKQYRYRDISNTTSYTDWGNWSDWSPDYVGSNDTTDVQTATIYGYYYFQCPGCGTRWHGWAFNCAGWGGGGCGTYIPEGTWHQMWSDVSWDQAGLQDFHGTGKYVTYYFGDRWFKWNDNGTPRKGYRYRTRSSYQEKNYGSWSNWSDSSYSDSSSREVETRTVYRYCDRTQTTTYQFYRWKEWSAWSTDSYSKSATRKVETSTFYRYRERANQKTYYYRRWSDWTKYSETPAYPSDTKEVKTKTQYRYKSKQKSNCREAGQQGRMTENVHERSVDAFYCCSLRSSSY